MQISLEILKEYWGYSSFRKPQEQVIQAVLEGKNVIALLPTGGGKSLCYQIPAIANEGICIVVSPLIALMQDQVESLTRKGIRAIALTGSLNQSEINRLLDNCMYGNTKFLYLSPERLQNEWVSSRLQMLNVNLIAIDEAHCISHWGKGFRPSYLLCKSLREWFPKTPMIALTATATHQVVDDIKKELLLEEATVIRSSLERSNLAYMVYKVEDKYSYLLRILKKNQGTCIIYLKNRQKTEEIANFLQQNQVSATYFHGGLPPEEKNKRLEMWLVDDIRVMVATNAFGMGIDKPDVRVVIHLDIPQSLEDYFQEVGRAGRDGKKSFGVLLYDENDTNRLAYNFRNSICEIDFLKLLYRKLNQYFQIANHEGEGTTHSFDFKEFCERYQFSFSKVYSGLSALESAGIIEKNESFHRKAKVWVKVSPQGVLKFMRENLEFYETLNYLIRTYTTIYDEMISIKMKRMASRLQYSERKIIHQFEKLAKADLIEYKAKNTDMEITFKVPRDDDRTINSVIKLINEYNQTKEKQYQAMIDYIRNTEECRSVQLLKYFGGTEIEPCGICSYCIENK